MQFAGDVAGQTWRAVPLWPSRSIAIGTVILCEVLEEGEAAGLVEETLVAIEHAAREGRAGRFAAS